MPFKYFIIIKASSTCKKVCCMIDIQGEHKENLNTLRILFLQPFFAAIHFKFLTFQCQEMELGQVPWSFRQFYLRLEVQLWFGSEVKFVLYLNFYSYITHQQFHPFDFLVKDHKFAVFSCSVGFTVYDQNQCPFIFAYVNWNASYLYK